MAISDKPILDPEPPKPGVPLKRSTIVVLVMLVMAVGLVSALFVSTSKPAAPVPAVAKDTTELKKTGTPEQIREEEAEAAKALQPKTAAASARAASASSLPASMPPLPASVRRDNNSSALFDQKGGPRGARGGAPGSERDVEMEATTRMAKALVTDFDPPKEGSSPLDQIKTNVLVPLGIQGQAARTDTPPSAAVQGELDAIRKQLTATKAGVGKAKDDWVREYAKQAAGPKLLTGYQAPTRLVLRQGKVIPAVLGRQINSDLPGRITAYVSTNVYDANGRLLVPMGSALIGKYDSGVMVGQERVMFAFERLVLPSGYSFDLPAAQGADLAGAAGMTGDVDNHFFKMFGTSLLIALLADQTQQPSNVTQVGTTGPVTAAGQVLSDVSKTILERNRVIPPTITVDQGTRINVEVVADMVFPEDYPAR